MEKYNDFEIAEKNFEILKNGYQSKNNSNLKNLQLRLNKILQFYKQTNKHYAIFLCNQNINLLNSHFSTEMENCLNKTAKTNTNTLESENNNIANYNKNKNCNKHIITQKNHTTFMFNKKASKHLSPNTINNYIAKTISTLCINVFEFSFFQSIQIIKIIKNLSTLLSE